MLWLTWPAFTKVITPPQRHVKVDTLSSAGALHSITVGAPATHGAGVAGMHGTGVSTPMAAEVAAATIGLAIEVHMPNDGMFMIGTWSMMFAAIMLLVITVLGVGTSVLGASPKLHFMAAPMQV
jgi:hypothetical protein